MTREDRLKVADRIVELSDQVLSRAERRYHFALKIGSGPNSNTVNVSKRFDRVSFFIRSSSLLRKAEAEGFKPDPAESTWAPNKDRFRFRELRLRDIEAHEALCKYPPAKPEALRLLAPQRGLIATGESKSKNKSKGLTVQTLLAQSRQNEGEHTPGTVKLLLPPRQSRGISQGF